MWHTISDGKIGEEVFYAGQNIGELCYLICCRQLLMQYGLFKAITEFAISLALVDLVTILFLNPNEIPVSKYMGFVISAGFLLIRLKNYLKT